ncbi:MAG: phosphomannomutase/phosphoglucomutase [Candidatus Binatus sp.]|uniref:phosphomannomutase/phosphoglucomutase n=1 Tax=Candidatus Binatus sp. TaxID=2811406 RepID=UPI00271A6C90|nr:phosphomannomutase/phosphoglucomutase [Candidatus Binatus sp.]
MNSQVFREYDIRGIVEQDFDDAFVTDLGRGYATLLHRAGAKTITLGRDCRLSSDRLRGRLLEGLLEAGIDVVDIGVAPTPLLYFSVLSWKMDGGVMITGSHNAAEYNGFKLGVGPATIYGAEIQKLREIIERRDFVTTGKPGNVTERAVIPDYNALILSQFKLKAGLKVVVDGGNGCGGVIAAPLMKQLGLDVIELYTEMDGRFPNHHPDPTVEENMRDLIAAVKKNRAAIGIAYDGDADRVGAVDENGKIVWGDELMVAFSRAILKERPGATIIGDVKCSKRMYDDIARHGGRPIMWKTGHSLIKSKLKAESAALAGEMSGHMFFADRYYGFDDAIYASFRLLEILSREGRGLATILSDLPRSFFTPEIRVDCTDDRKFQIVSAAAEYFRQHYDVTDIDGVRVNFADGWGLVRASNTQPALVTRFEATSEKRLGEIRELFDAKLRELGAN